MKKIALLLAVAMTFALAGCGDDSKPKTAFLPFVAHVSGSSAPQLFTLDPKTKKTTPVAIPIPSQAQYVTANSDASAVVYMRRDTTGWDVFLMGTDGKEKQLTTGAATFDTTFSPDGKTIAYANTPSGGLSQIFTMNADGSNQKALYTPPANTLYQSLPQFSPDGKSLVFFVEMYSDSVQPARGQNGARRSSLPPASVGEPQTVASDLQPTAATPSVNGWYKMALTDTTPIFVFSPKEYAWGPAVFSEDAKKLLITTRNGGNVNNVYSVNLDGTGLTPLTTSADTDDYSAVPFNGQIFFNRYNNTSHTWDIYVMDQSGANQALVLTAPNTDNCLIDAYWDND